MTTSREWRITSRKCLNFMSSETTDIQFQYVCPIGAGADTPEQNSHDAGSELFQAASSGNVSMTQALLSATGAQSYINYTDGHGRTSLFIAACNGHVPIVTHLMTARCSINLATATGSTQLLVAAKQGHTVIVSQLITARCNVDLAMANGSTPLLVAAKQGHTAIVSQLITARCNVDLQKKNGFTATLRCILWARSRLKAAPCCALQRRSSGQ